jgi:hypothetical protein
MRIAGGATPIGRSALGVYVSLAAQVATLAALVVFEETRGQRLARQIAVFGGDPAAPGARAVVGAVTVFALLMMALAAATLAAAAAYLSWLRRVCREIAERVPYRQRARGDDRAGMVSAALLIPGVNLVAPPFLLNAVWREAARGRDLVGRRAALVAAWWLSWLVALWLILVRLPLHHSAESPDLTGLGLTELTAVAVAALLCALTVRDLTRSLGPAAQPSRMVLRVLPEITPG